MSTPEVISYIKKELGRDVRDDKIKNALIEQGGWSSQEVEEAFEQVRAEKLTQLPKEPEEPKSVSREKPAPRSDFEVSDEQVKADKLHSIDARRRRAENQSSAQTKTKSRRSGIRWGRILLVIITLALLAATAYGGWLWWQSRQTSSEEIIIQALVSYLEAESISSTSEAELSLGELLSLSGSFEVDVEIGETPIDTALALTTDLRSTSDSGVSGAVGELRVVDGVSYLKIDELPSSVESTSTEQLIGTWLSQEIESRDYDAGFSQEAIELVKSRGVRSLRLAQDTSFLTITEVPSSQTSSGGAGLYVYRLDLHLENTATFLRALADSQTNGRLASRLHGLADTLDDNWDQVTEVVEGELVVPVTVAIERGSYHPVSLSIELFQQISHSAISSLTGQNQIPVSLSLHTEFHSLNESLNIIAPAESRPAEEFRSLVSDISLRPSQTKLNDDSVKALLSQAKNQAGAYYKNSNQSYEGLCKSEAVKSLLSQAVDTSPSDHGPADHCLDTADSWIILISLHSSREVSYCVDSSGTTRAGAPTDRPDAQSGYRCRDY